MANGKILEEIGFTKAEAVVYLALLKLGKTKSGNIIKISGLQSSVVHNALNTLINKGFVTYILEGKVKKYNALDPKLIEKYIESKKQEFKRILPDLESLKSQEKGVLAIAEVYEGWKGLHVATLNLIENRKRGDVYKYFTAEKSLLTEEALKFFQKIDLLKKEYGIKVKGIAEIGHKNILKNYKNSEIRYTSLKIPPAMNIFNDKIIIMSLSEKPVSILIKSKGIANQYHRLWDNLWILSKP